MHKKQIGELFVVGYQGEPPSYDFLSFVEEWGIGGVIVFARNLENPENLRKNLKIIEEASGKEIFTAIDQEGGLVLRILNNGSLFPSAMGISATGDLQLCEDIYFAIGNEMQNFGLNFNLAPVLDINHKDNPGIGARSFGETPETVANFGVRAIKGLKKSGVMSCAKHFPGKGHAQVDSHLTLPIIPYPVDRLESFELFPFIKAIESGVDAIMTSHVFFPAFEPCANLPATLSKNVLTNLIRNKYNYEGLIITDDLEMGAITERYGIANASELAFDAGADLLLICHTLTEQRLAAENLYKKAQNSKETSNRVIASLQRIEKMRTMIGTFPKTSFRQTELIDKHRDLIETVSEKSIKFLRYEKSAIPAGKEKKHLLFVLPMISALVKVEEEHESAGLAKLCSDFFTHSKQVIYNPTWSSREIINAVSVFNNSETQIIFFSYNSHIFRGQSEAIKTLSEGRDDFILAAIRNPYDLLEQQQVRTLAATFGFRTPAILALLRVLAGEKSFSCDGWPIRV